VVSELDRRPPFEAILHVLSREDPEGLLAIGAPTDEYAHEAHDLARWLRDGRPITGEVLVEVWERSSDRAVGTSGGLRRLRSTR
jgi:hypothetical protein